MAAAPRKVLVSVYRADGNGNVVAERNQVLQVALQPNVSTQGAVNVNLVDSSHSDGGSEASLSKNAILARQNRLKKKCYVRGLEENLKKARAENEELQKKLQERDARVEALQDEVRYLKSVLANSNEISGLLRTLKRGSRVPLTTSLEPPSPKRIRRGSDSSFSETEPATSPLLTDADPVLKTQDGNGAGVCLHVFNRRVSLEFCHHCARNAGENLADETRLTEDWLPSLDNVESWDLADFSDCWKALS